MFAPIQCRSPEEVKQSLQLWKDRENLREIHPGIRGVIVNIMNKVCGNDLHRRIVLHYLFGDKPGIGEISTKQLQPWQWYALNEWIKPFHDDVDDEWKYSQDFAAECREIVWHIVPRLPF